jgi:hypothetical protein
MESSSLNYYTPQVPFGSRKAPLSLAGREGGSCRGCTNAERMPLVVLRGLEGVLL